MFYKERRSKYEQTNSKINELDMGAVIMVNVAAIFSTLGNPNSLIPLAVKDVSSTTAITASSFFTGKEEGQDRLIDEVGTQIIWLLGIPAFKWLFDKTVFKAYGLDSKFDVRNLKDKDVFEKIKEYAPTDKVKENLEKIGNKQGVFKNVALYKFFFATGATIASYIGLTRAKQHYTENQIKQNLIKEHYKKQEKENTLTSARENSTFKGIGKEGKYNSVDSTSFKGIGEIVKNFAFSPVKNMWILDGAITGERLYDSRSPQEFMGYSIKEGLYLFFMYYAGNRIQKALEKRADKKFNKSIGLDARVIEGGKLQKAFEDGSVKESLEAFAKIKDNSDAEIYEFLMKNPENDVVKVAKDSDIIALYEKTNKVDTRKFIDMEKIKKTHEKIDKLYNQFLKATEGFEELQTKILDAKAKGDKQQAELLENIAKNKSPKHFFEGVKKLKRHSIITNIGTCIFALSIVTPAAMLAKRLLGKDNAEFQTKKEIREQLIKDGIISKA